MSDVQQKKPEPQIVVGDLTNEELANWMGNKVHAISCLSIAVSRKETLERQLAETNANIERYSADAAIDVIRPASVEASSEEAEPKKGRVVQILVNGALLASLNTCDAVAADYLLFLEGAISAVMNDKDSLEREANNSGRTIKGHGLSFIGSVSIPEVTNK